MYLRAKENILIFSCSFALYFPLIRLSLSQTCDSYFSYRPILQSLQNIAQDATPLLQNIVCPREGRVEMPAYIQQNTRYDFSMLLDPDKMQALEGWRENNPVGRVCLKDEEALTEATAFLRQHSILDEAQLQAVLAALTEELVLIQGVCYSVCVALCCQHSTHLRHTVQVPISFICMYNTYVCLYVHTCLYMYKLYPWPGPPGTGKSFVGIKIAQLLVANSLRTPRMGFTDENGAATSPSITPILCLCYTNHALDQVESYLESYLFADLFIRGKRQRHSVLLSFI